MIQAGLGDKALFESEKGRMMEGPRHQHLHQELQEFEFEFEFEFTPPPAPAPRVHQEEQG